jgi:hypothetical protein
MNKLTEVQLGLEGIKYIEMSLRDAGVGLSERLLDLNLLQGCAYTVLPEDNANLERALKFSIGSRMDSSIAYNWLASHIYASLSKNTEGSIIFHDAWGAKHGDAVLKENKSNFFFYQSAVQYFVVGKNVAVDTILNSIKKVHSFLFVGALVNVSVIANKLPASKIVDNGFMNNIVKHTQEIYVSAYDREGVVIWKRE